MVLIHYLDYRHDFPGDGNGALTGSHLSHTIEYDHQAVAATDHTNSTDDQIKLSGGGGGDQTHIIVNPQPTPKRDPPGKLTRVGPSEAASELVRPYDTVQAATSMSATNSPFVDKKSMQASGIHRHNIHQQVRSEFTNI